MAKTAYPTQSTSHIGRIRHRRNGAKPAKWATNAATKSPTVANTVERGIAPGRMRGERGAQDRTAGGTHRLPHAYSARVQRSERGRAAAGEGRRTAGQRGDLSALPHVGLRPYSRQRHRGYESRHARHRVGWRFQSAGRIPRGVDGCDAARLEFGRRRAVDVVQHRTACGT